MRRLLATALSGLCAVSLAAPARASVILSLSNNGRTAVSGGYDYTYAVTLSQDEQLNPAVQPVFFTLYSFGPSSLVGATGNLANGNWTFQLNQNQAVAAEGVVPNNTPNFDVRATYTGPQELPTSVPTGNGNLGSFTLFTTDTGPYAIFANDQDAQLEKYAPGAPTNNTATSNLAAVAVPSLERTAIPEPAPVALLAAAVASLGLIRRWRSQKA